MARQRLRDLPIVCRSYWVKPADKQLPKEVMDEAFRMNQLWNGFVAIGEEFREKYQHVLAKDPAVAAVKTEYEEADAAVTAAYEEFKKAKIRFRTKKGSNTKPFQDSYNELKARRKEISKRLKEAKACTKESKREELGAVGKAFLGKIDEEWKKAYRGSLYWANANAVKDSYLKAWKNGLKTGHFPKFHRFTGEARFCHQFIGGISTDKLFSRRSEIFSLAPYDTSCYHNPDLKPRQKKKFCRTFMTFQIGGIPVKFHINIHREIPKGYLKQAVLIRKKVGTNIEWSVSFTLEEEEPQMVSSQPAAIAAIDLGFRIIDDRMRIGVLVADDRREEIWLPDKVIAAKRHAKELQSERDTLFEKAKAKTFEMLPSGLSPELKANWDKARQPRLIKIMRHLKDTGHFLADELGKWHVRDRRLFDEISGLNARALRHRKWAYYNIANRLFDTYGTLIVENLNLGDMAKKERADGSANELVKAAREYRTIASLGEFLSILRDVAKKKGTTIEEAEAAYSTMKCSICGGLCHPSDRAKLLWKCEHCGSEWDQDFNAATNLYAGYQQTGTAACSS